MGKFNGQKTKLKKQKTNQNFGTSTNPLVLDSKFYPVKFTDVANANKIRLQNAVVIGTVHIFSDLFVQKCLFQRRPRRT